LSLPLDRAPPNKTVPCYVENTKWDSGGSVDVNRSYIAYLIFPAFLNQRLKFLKYPGSSILRTYASRHNPKLAVLLKTLVELGKQ